MNLLQRFPLLANIQPGALGTPVLIILSSR